MPRKRTAAEAIALYDDLLFRGKEAADYERRVAYHKSDIAQTRHLLGVDGRAVHRERSLERRCQRMLATAIKRMPADELAQLLSDASEELQDLIVVEVRNRPTAPCF